MFWFRPLTDMGYKLRKHQLYCTTLSIVSYYQTLAATLRWFMAGGAIRIAVRQLSQTWKLRHYDVIDDVITRKL